MPYGAGVTPAQHPHYESSGHAAAGDVLHLRWIVRDVELWCVNDRLSSSPRAFVMRASCRGRATVKVHGTVLQSVAMRLEDAQVFLECLQRGVATCFSQVVRAGILVHAWSEQRCGSTRE